MSLPFIAGCGAQVLDLEGLASHRGSLLGGLPGGRSEKILKRVDGSEERLPSKCDEIQVQPGDMLIYRTAGGGGWKDRLDRPVERADDLVRNLAVERPGEIGGGFPDQIGFPDTREEIR